MENFKSLFDLTKLPTKFFVLFAAISGFILFANKTILNKIHLENLNQKYGWIIGLTFIIASGLVLINLLIWTFDNVSAKLKRRKLIKEFKLSLKKLDSHEKAVLREFILNDQSSIKAPIDDAVVSGLLKKRILLINRQLGSSFIMNGTNAPVSLHPIAEEILTYEDLDLPSDPTENERFTIMQNRPSWTINARW